jgi:hypothetical protein
MSKRQELLEKIIITSLSLKSNSNKIVYDYAFVNEHGFYGCVIDTASLDLFEPGLPQNNRLISAINYPYQGLSKDSALDCLVKTFSIMNSSCMGVITSLDKSDVESGNYEKMREVLLELSELSAVEKRVAVEFSWLKSDEHLSKLLSVVAPYEEVRLVFSGFLSNPKDLKELKQAAKICKVSGFDNYEYFGSVPNKISNIFSIFDMGYKLVGTPSQAIPKLLLDKL